MTSKEEILADNLLLINKYKLTSMLHVFLSQLNQCQSAHDAMMLMIEAEVNINELFSDIDINQDDSIKQMATLHLAALTAIDWDASPQLIRERMHFLKDKLKRDLVDNEQGL